MCYGLTPGVPGAPEPRMYPRSGYFLVSQTATNDLPFRIWHQKHFQMYFDIRPLLQTFIFEKCWIRYAISFVSKGFNNEI